MNDKKFQIISGVNIISEKGCKEIPEKKIYELSEEEAKKYKLLGEAEGQNFDHCVYLGWRHAENFLERVYGYRIEKPERKDMRIKVIFYEELPAVENPREEEKK